MAAIVGGAKVSTKLDLLGNLVNKVDILIIGGGMANTFLFAQGKAVGKSLCEKDIADTARVDPGRGEKHEMPHSFACRCDGGEGVQGACAGAGRRCRPCRRRTR